MKSILIAVLLIPLAALYAEDEPPKVPLAEASRIAQQTLESLKLGPEYYLRSIQLVGGTAESQQLQYEAKFEPPVVRRRVVLGTETDPPPPATYRVIVVEMDGTASVIERERSSTRSIVRPGQQQ